MFLNERKVKVAQSCPALCDPMDCSLLGFSVHGILQARILEWVAVPFSKGSSWPRDQTCISCIAGRFSTVWATRQATSPIWYKCQGKKEMCWGRGREKGSSPPHRVAEAERLPPQVPERAPAAAAGCLQWYCFSREPKLALVPPHSQLHPGTLQHPLPGSEAA